MAGMKSRWFRFSLRTLLLLIAVLCIWLGIQVNAARRQREAVAVLLNAGAEIYYDYQMVPLVTATPPGSFAPPGIRLPDTWADVSQLPPGPAWLRERIGDDYFRTVVDVYCRGTFQKSDLDELVELPHVKEFVLVGTGFHDEDLTALGELRQLEVLQFSGTPINGSILAQLPNPRRLKNLHLSHTNIDDTALEEIEKMTGLEVLGLDGTHVTDAGLRHLRNLTNLRNVYLQNTQITDAGLQHLSGLKTLTLVVLGPSPVTQDGVSALRAALPSANIIGQ
jgi:hypothetical protein